MRPSRCSPPSSAARQTGEGSEVRIPLSDVAIGTVANLGGIAEVLYSGANRPRLGNAVYGLFGRDFVTKDGVRTMIVVVTHRQWANLLVALGLNDAVAAIEAAARRQLCQQ
jgi:2-methylfumaryl-CoA isomerase